MHLRLVKTKMLLLLDCMPSNYLTSVFVDSGNEANECPSIHMFCLLLQSLVRMKVTVDDGTERFSVSVSPEATGTCSPESHPLVLLQLNSHVVTISMIWYVVVASVNVKTNYAEELVLHLKPYFLKLT